MLHDVVDGGPALGQRIVFAGTSPTLLPVNTRRGINVGLMLAQHPGRWTNIKPTLVCWV